MLKHLPLITLAIALFASAQLFACDDNIACDKCAKESEFSWNPNNQFVTARLSRFYSLGDQITAAYEANDFVRLKELTKEYLGLAAIYRCNWNYGNAIHDTNRMLGLVSLKHGDADAAADYLLKAGKSTGSPQLDTFGPELDLANELLQRGKVDAVIVYLRDIKSFWKMNNGQIDTWLAEIENGEKPELDRFAVHKPGPLLMFIFWLVAVWPLIVSTAFLYTKRKRIKRKMLFFIIAVSSGYAAMYLANWIIGYGIQAIISGTENLSHTTIYLMSYLPFGTALLLPFLATFFQARFFYSNAKERSR